MKATRRLLAIMGVVGVLATGSARATIELYPFETAPAYPVWPPPRQDVFSLEETPGIYIGAFRGWPLDGPGRLNPVSFSCSLEWIAPDGQTVAVLNDLGVANTQVAIVLNHAVNNTLPDWANVKQPGEWHVTGRVEEYGYMYNPPYFDIHNPYEVDVAFTVVPEPSTWLAGALLLLVFGVSRGRPFGFRPITTPAASAQRI